MEFECIDEQFSTTRRLTRTPPEPDPCFQVPSIPVPAIVGGLRTRGFYKGEGPEPLLTIVTIAYNCAASIEETMFSVLNQTYSNIEYIIIDGGSIDGTLDVIKKHEHAIDYWLSEPDMGIYDAMNKGIRASTGKWLNFMNVKDTFASDTTVENVAAKNLQSGAKFIYSDVLLINSDSNKGNLIRLKCDHKKLIINHQGSIYQKNLHREYGLYLVAKGMTISDYLFFSLIDKKNYLKTEEPIANYDATGISQSKASLGQKLIVDYLINGMPRHEFVIRFHLAYYYRVMRNLVLRLLIERK